MKRFFQKVKEHLRRLFSTTSSGGKPSPLSALDSINFQAFFKRPIQTIMSHRGDMASLQSTQSLAQVFNFFYENQTSFAFVFAKGPDQMLGILHKEALFNCLYKKGFLHEPLPSKWYSLITDIPFAPFSATILDGWIKLSESKAKSLAIFDEHGGICGSVSLENITQAFTQYYLQESQREPSHSQLMAPQEDGTMILSGRTPLDLLEKNLHCTFPSPKISLSEGASGQDVRTLGGWLSRYDDKIPLPGQILHPEEGWCFVIQESDTRRIHKVVLIEWPTKHKYLDQDQAQ